MTPTKAQIGRAGELLVQTKFLLRGIESAQMTTDIGAEIQNGAYGGNFRPVWQRLPG